MAKLTQLEIQSYLAEPYVANLVTVRADGRPHVAPVWFQWQQGRALVMTGQSSSKVRNLRNNPAVTLSIATGQRPYWYINLEGEANITEDDLVAVVNRICIRYDGPEAGAAFAQELLDQGNMVIIDIMVNRVVSWLSD